MLKKFHNILGRLFLSGTSFFWASCDSGTSAEKPSALIDVNQEMAKLKQPDTTGLKGQCISVKSYCDVIDDELSPFQNYYANTIAREKIDELLKSKNFSNEKRICYANLVPKELPAPLYGVPYCQQFSLIETYQDILLPDNESDTSKDWFKSQQDKYQHYLKDNNLTACTPITDGVHIDDKYINAALQNEQRSREAFRSYLEYINKEAAECETFD